jgi:hypothetical protein
MRRDDRRLGMPTLVVILVVATAASMPAAQKPTIARNQNPPRYDYLWVSASRLANSSALDNFSAVGYAPIALWRSGFMPLDEFGNPPDVDAESYFVLLENTRA